MKMKKLLLSITALAGLVGANASYAAKIGIINAGTSATAICSASRFFPGGTPGPLVQDKLAGGLLTDFLIMNSDAKPLQITQIDVYAMNGTKIVSYTPANTVPASINAADPVFQWTVAPHATTRLSHEAVLPLTQVVNPALLWNSVVFKVKAANYSRMVAPLVYSEYAEYAKSPVPDKITNGLIIDRIRSACEYR